MLDLIAVGEVLLDVHAPALEPGGAVHGPVRLRVGGTPVNAALAARAEGASAAVIGRVGDDAAGRLARETLAGAGVEAWLAVDPGAPTGSFLAAGDAVAADPGASRRLSAADLPDELRAGAVLVSEYAPGMVARAVVDRAEATWVAAPGGNARFSSGGELDSAYRLSCVTLGPAGAVASLDGAVERRAPPEVLAEPLVGAGDTLAAVLLVSLLRGLPLGEALERAVGASARLRRTRP